MKKSKSPLVTLTAINGTALTFQNHVGTVEERSDVNCEKINKVKFTNELRGLHVAENLRIIWERGGEQLKEIMKNSQTQKLFKQTIHTAKQALGMIPTEQPSLAPAMKLEDKKTAAPIMKPTLKYNK
jgi:hypothetical protein